MNTTSTFTFTTDNSTAISALLWESDGKHSTGDLYVTYRTGRTYRFEGVRFDHLAAVMDASDENRSIGAAVNAIADRYKRGTLVA